MLPFAFALLVASPLAGILSARIGGKPLLVIGLVILAASDIRIARFRVDTRMSELILPFAVMGVGMGGAPAGMDARMPKETAAGIQLALKRSFTDGVNDTFRIAAIVGAGAVLVSLLMAGRRRSLLIEERGAPVALRDAPPAR
jgi:MFS family permease